MSAFKRGGIDKIREWVYNNNIKKVFVFFKMKTKVGATDVVK